MIRSLSRCQFNNWSSFFRVVDPFAFLKFSLYIFLPLLLSKLLCLLLEQLGMKTILLFFNDFLSTIDKSCHPGKAPTALSRFMGHNTFEGSHTTRGFVLTRSLCHDCLITGTYPMLSFRIDNRLPERS